jgi:outer membrane receptor protein involved in Fe transport
VIDERAILNLPLNGRRFTDLVLLTPGATQDPRGQNSSQNGDLSFGGVRGFQTNYLVDGGDNNNAFFAQARGRYRAPYQFSNEVVQEFRVSRNSVSAESGRAGGAVVNVVTKSGTNKFHGTGFYYLRDSSFNARSASLDIKPYDRQQQFGFTFGGPVKRNRAFFFAVYDQHVFHQPTVVRFINGSSVVLPQASAGPATPGDYEASDLPLVLDAASQLSRQSGIYPSKLLGNAGFAKLDLNLFPHNLLSARMNTSRYSGENNVFLDPSSPMTTYAISDNGVEHVETETASVSLTSSLSLRMVSHLRAQFSRDLQWSQSNSSTPLTRIPGIIDGFGRSTILPRETREHRGHLAETISREGQRHSWKFGGDALLTKIHNFFPSTFGGEYIFSTIKVDPFTFEPLLGGMELTPLRAYAHEVPHYYFQRFGPALSHPNTNEYAVFAQDTMRLTDHFGLTLGVRYDLQTFATKYLKTNPLWPDSGKVPLDLNNFAPRAGVSYAFGADILRSCGSATASFIHAFRRFTTPR